MAWTLKKYFPRDPKEKRRKVLKQYAKRRGKQKVLNELYGHSKFFADMPSHKGTSNKIFFDYKWLKNK